MLLLRLLSRNPVRPIVSMSASLLLLFLPFVIPALHLLLTRHLPFLLVPAPSQPLPVRTLLRLLSLPRRLSCRMRALRIRL
jgi:hypothetical protein